MLHREGLSVESFPKAKISFHVGVLLVAESLEDRMQGGWYLSSDIWVFAFLLRSTVSDGDFEACERVPRSYIAFAVLYEKIDEWLHPTE